MTSPSKRPPTPGQRLRGLEERIEGCSLCPRLRAHCTKVAEEKRRAYRDETYWGRPVAGFGAVSARIVWVGLAPGAHGANRTGRVFTGDSSGRFLYGALNRHGLATQPESVHRTDKLRLRDCWITNVVRCAPPDNRPSTKERDTCLPYFQDELSALTRARVFVALGKFAYDELVRLARASSGPRMEKTSRAPRASEKTHGSRSDDERSFPPFGHGTEFSWGRRTVLASYHPSQQNTQTGRLTVPMFDEIVTRAIDLSRSTPSAHSARSARSATTDNSIHSARKRTGR